MLTQKDICIINGINPELDIPEKQKEVISILACLKSIENLKQGYKNVALGMKISQEGMTDFVNLLNPNEYLKGYNNGGNDIFGEHPKEHKYDIYYLTLGTGNVLELTFCETKMKEFKYPTIESSLNIRSFTDSQDLSIKVNSEPYGWPIIEILGKNGNSVFEANTTDEYLKFNNQSLNEALVAISVEDFANRFLDMLKNQEKEHNEKTKKLANAKA